MDSFKLESDGDEKLKNKVKYYLLAFLIIINIINIAKINGVFDRDYKDFDMYVKQNISSEISMLFLTIDRLDRELLVDDRYKSAELKTIEILLTDSEKYIREIDESVSELKLINKNFDLNLNGFSNYLYKLKQKSMADIRLSEKDMDILRDIKSVRKKYSNAAVMELYELDRNGLEDMKLPEKTRLLFDEINQLTNED